MGMEFGLIEQHVPVLHYTLLLLVYSDMPKSKSLPDKYPASLAALGELRKKAFGHPGPGKATALYP